MTRKQENKRTMMGVTADTLNEAPVGAIAGIPGATALVDWFLDINDSITANSELQNAIIKGSAEKKALRRKEMVDKTLNLELMGRSYAVDINSPELKQELSWTEAKLMHVADTICADVCKNVLDKLVALATELLPYGVTVALTDDAVASVAAYRVYIPEPRKKIVKRSVSTKEIDKLINEGIVILEKLDIKLAPLVTSRPEFLSKYMSSRIVVSTGGRVIALRFTVVDVDGNPVDKAIITFEGLRLVKKTTAKGNCQVHHFEPGNYRATLKKFGMVDKVVDFSINAGLRTKIDVVMEMAGVGV